MKFKKLSTLFKLSILCITIPFILVSCLKNDSEDNTALYEQQFTKWKNDGTNWDSVGYNVYMNVTNLSSDTSKPTSKNAVLISYNCYNGEGELIATTNDSIAVKYDIHKDDYIYGPYWAELQYTIPGIYVALQHLTLYSSATIIIPYDMAGYLGPLKYEVTLHKIVSDFDQFEDEQRTNYMNIIGFFSDDTVYTAIDSTLWYKLIGSDDFVKKDILYGTDLIIQLTANYCEVLPGLAPASGRQFFPINNKGTEVEYYFQDSYYFPITPAIDTMVDRMLQAGDHEADFITTSANTYGSSGFLHPTQGVYIIPPYKSIHYTVKISEIK